MNRRKEANRAEAIVKGVGAIVLLLILLAMVYAVPHLMKGKNTDEMLHSMLDMLLGFALLAGAVVVIGLIVWFKVLKRKK
jgi:small-conductance mechanosensitive channel